MSPNQLRLLRFAINHVTSWMHYGHEVPTVRALVALERKGLIELNRKTRQFRLNSTSTPLAELRATQ